VVREVGGGARAGVNVGAGFWDCQTLLVEEGGGASTGVKANGNGDCG